MQRERRKIMIAMFQQMQICLRHNSSCGYGFLVITVINIFNFIFLSYINFLFLLALFNICQGTMLYNFWPIFPWTLQGPSTWCERKLPILSSSISPFMKRLEFLAMSISFWFFSMWSQRHRQAKKGGWKSWQDFALQCGICNRRG